MYAWRRENKVIREVREFLRGLAQLDRERSNANVNLVVDQELWRGSKTRTGEPFSSLPQWVASPEPEGLGVRDQKTARFLRMLLLNAGRLDVWAVILVHVSPGPGRPKTLVGDEDFRPFYRVSTASNAIDRRLHRLFTKEPDVFASVASGAISLAEAEAKIDWATKPSRPAFCALNPVSLDQLIEAFKLLNERGQAEMLDALWECTTARVRSMFTSKQNVGD